jgi:tetratricopeptide (TPR) repeat protein
MTARLLATIALLAAFAAAAVGLQVVRERYQALHVDDVAVLLPPQAIDRMVFAHRPLVADLYWIRAIQYYGRQRHQLEDDPLLATAVLADRAQVTFDDLYPLLDIATTLDPFFNIAYRFGSIFLSSQYPGGAGRPDQAVALLEKGFRARPDKWEYLHDIGFVYYWDMHDYVKAAEFLNRAADIPGAPWWLRGTAATTLAKGGQRSTSRMLWRQIFETATDDSAREAAALKLRQLDALDQIEDLQRRVDQAVARTGARDLTWRQLAAAGVVPGSPVDSSGTPYELDADLRVRLSSRSPLFPLPVEPAARTPAP